MKKLTAYWKMKGVASAPMHYFKKLITLFFLAYLTSPLWEEPVSNYVDVSFLDTIDAKVIKGYEFIKDQPYIDNTIDDLSSTIATLPEKLNMDANKTSYAPVNQVEKPTLATPTDGLFSVHNIQIGDKMDRVTVELGNAKRITTNEYGSEWHTFHKDYQNFMMVSLTTLLELMRYLLITI